MTASETDRAGHGGGEARQHRHHRIMELLPHRYPMLMIDRIEDIKLGISATGIKNVTVNEPFFQGHWPGRPIMPGVLIVEAMAQTAGALVMHALGARRADEVVCFMGIDKARFRKPVVPGDTLKLGVRLIRSARRCGVFRASTRRGRAARPGRIFGHDHERRARRAARDLMAQIHPTAIVEAGAGLSADVKVGPFCVIGPKATIGERTELISHVTVSGADEIGPIASFIRSFRSAARLSTHATRARMLRSISARADVIREHVTMNQARRLAAAKPRSAMMASFMIGGHVAHDCVMGTNVIFTNNVVIGGHVEVGNYVKIGGNSAVHQFARIGDYAFVGGMTGVETMSYLTARAWAIGRRSRDLTSWGSSGAVFHAR